MLKLKLQYFGHLMGRANSWEKTLMVGKVEGKRRRGVTEDEMVGWHHIISSSLVPFSSYLQSFPASGSFQMSQFFTSGGQSIGVSASASVVPMNIQD